MAAKVASLYAEIGADTSKLKQGLTESKAGLQDLKGEADKAKSGLSSAFYGAADVVGKAGAAVAIFGATFKAAMDFGKAGAQLEVTRTRFDRLSYSIGTTGDKLLNKLKPAIGGLMSDAKIVESATQIMSLGLANDEESVVRLATLTTKLGWDMQQVILTFANNSKMRLDALGLSVTDVEERAKRLEAQGYNTDKAFDMAVIEAGEAKLKLLGDQAEMGVGKFARLDAAIENVSNRLKEKFAPGLANAAEALTLLLTWNEKVATAQGQQAAAVEKTSKTYGEYAKAILDSYIATGQLTAKRRDWILADIEAGKWSDVLTKEYGLQTQATWEATRATAESAKVHGLAASTLDDYAGKVAFTAEEIGKLRAAQSMQYADTIQIGSALRKEAGELADLRSESSDTSRELAKLAAENQKLMGLQGKVRPLSMKELEDAYKNLSRAMEDVAHGNRSAQAEVEKWDAVIGGKAPKQFYDFSAAISDNAEKMAELGKAEGERYTAFITMSKEATLATLEEKFAREGWSEAEVAAYTNSAVSMGLMTQAQADQAASMATLNAAFDTGKLTAQQYADALMINRQNADNAKFASEGYGNSLKAAMEEPAESVDALTQTFQNFTDVAEFQTHRVLGGDASVVSDLEDIKAISNSSKESIGEPLNEAMYMVRDAAAEAGGAIGGAVGGLNDLKGMSGMETHFWVITHTKEIVEPGEDRSGGAPAGGGPGGGPGGGGNTARQSGGPVFPNQTYLVGERGPELFSPQASGFINPGVGGVNIGPINITSQPGMSEQALANRVVNALSVKFGQRVRALRSAGAGRFQP